MSIASYALPLLFSATSLIANSSTDQMQICADAVQALPSQPEQSSRTLQLDNLGIEVDIPKNFRTMRHAQDLVSVMPPADYSYFQCLVENQVRTAPYLHSVLLYQDVPASEALILTQSSGRIRNRFLTEETVNGQQAFIYTVTGGMNDNLVVRINYPDQQRSLVISTNLENGDEVPMEETLERILASIRFL